VTRLAVPLKALVQRFAVLFLVLTAFALMLLSKAETVVVDRAAATISDIAAPIMDVLSRPAASLNDAIAAARNLAYLRTENQRLKQENARLRTWQEAAHRLAVQNRALQALLDFKPDPQSRYVSARVVGDSGGAFVRSMLLNAGKRDGVAKGQAVVTGDGLVGRIVSAGQWSSRVLLITDINSRVPVIVESARDRAILAGDNTNLPKLAFLPGNTVLKPGDRVVTSGDGGVFPPGLPVGRVASVGDGGIRVQPFVRLDSLEFVRTVDYAGVSKAIPDDDEPRAEDETPPPEAIVP
jgi:rod shape-determining protein MreC